ncbi:hypothetical protein ASPCAL08519 [Aspergillus calidoustus]|uniref:Uncharacterized protein n=1 Tax=Aspergillus calidoustus TaxID=454130 RepID=A0A0U5GRR4_ASPCI|nr:hypothetical protein ASPCAL08519 [Aspergillus calidoustus]
MAPKYSAILPGAINAESIGLKGDHLPIVKYNPVKSASMQIIGQRLRVLVELATEAPQKRPKPPPNPIDGASREKPTNIRVAPMESQLGPGLPEIRNPRFTGRESILKNMSDTLHGGVDSDRQ